MAIERTKVTGVVLAMSACDRLFFMGAFRWSAQPGWLASLSNWVVGLRRFHWRSGFISPRGPSSEQQIGLTQALLWPAIIPSEMQADPCVFIIWDGSPIYGNTRVKRICRRFDQQR